MGLPAMRKLGRGVGELRTSHEADDSAISWLIEVEPPLRLERSGRRDGMLGR